MAEFDLPRRGVAEFLGTWFLVATVVGSGIMAEKLAGGNVAVALLCNTMASGIRPADAPWFVVAEIVGALLAAALFRWLLAGKSSRPVDGAVPSRLAE